MELMAEKVMPAINSAISNQPSAISPTARQT
jgi:hypothetical protein